MNQILDYNPNKGSGGGNSSGSDKIVRVFAVILAVFAIALLAAGGYGIYKNKFKSNIPTQAASKAEIKVEQQETVALVDVTHDKVIEKLIYSWDSEKETTIKGTGESVMHTEVPLFAGEHTLNIKVVDIEGNETTFEQLITSETGEDKIYPVIKLEVTDERKLRITATDETAIDFVTYRWNDEEEQKVEETDEEGKKIEFEIDVLKGNNDLTIVAVDKSNNTTTEPKNFSGVTKPDIKITISADKTKANVYCFHENGLKQIKVKFNDDAEQYVGLPEEAPKEARFDLDLPIGNTNITVTASSIDETETVATERVENQQENTDVIDISMEKVEGEDKKIMIKAQCEAGIKEFKLNVNDVEYPIGLGEGEAPKEAKLPFTLPDGDSKVTVTIVSVNGTEKEETQEFSY